MLLVILALQASAMSPQGQAVLKRNQEQVRPQAEKLMTEGASIINQIKAELAAPSPNPQTLRRLFHSQNQIMRALQQLTNPDRLFDQLPPADQIAFLRNAYGRQNTPPSPPVFIPPRH